MKRIAIYKLHKIIAQFSSGPPFCPGAEQTRGGGGTERDETSNKRE